MTRRTKLLWTDEEPLAPDTNATKTAWLWAYARDDSAFGGSGPPLVAYRFEDSQSGDCVRRHLGNYRGILQVNGYAAYNKLIRKNGGNDSLRLAGCWAHSRRRFFELHVAGASEIATATVERMTELWKLEAEVRGQGPEVHARPPPHPSTPICSPSGSRPCPASRENRSWLRPCAMPSPGARSSSAS